MSSRSASTVTAAAALTATLGVAAVCWIVALRQMNGMDMGVARRLGSFAFFVGVWVSMMAAMMLPGAARAVVRHAAGVYELTPLKTALPCRENVRSGIGFGFDCVGSSIGLMLLLLVALGVMSITWMSVIAVVVLAQKLLPERAVVDVALALAIVDFGIVILVSLSSISGLAPVM